MELGADRTRHVPRPLGLPLADVPLLTHAHYRREEILGALSWASMERKARCHASGVAWAPTTRTDALLVNLRKTERDFSPTTMYRDYAISPDLFHRESQNATTVASTTGRRYLRNREQGTPRGPLRAGGAARRPRRRRAVPQPRLCDYVSHRGEPPIAISWRLHRRMPGEAFRSASIVAS